MNQLSPIDWAKRPIEKYADFTGRAPRAEYWWFLLAVIIVFIVLNIIESIIGLNRMILGVYGPLAMLLWLGTLVPSIAVGIRRLHDTSRSGWWMLLLVPYVVSAIMMVRSMAAGSAVGFGSAGVLGLIGLACCIVLLVFYCLPGTPGDNLYGPNPYGAGAVAAE